MNIQVELTEKDFSFDIGFSGETDFNKNIYNKA